MTDDDWRVGYAKSLAVLAQRLAPWPSADRHGRHDPRRLVLPGPQRLGEAPRPSGSPAPKWGGPWQVVLDTSDDKPVYKPLC